MADITVSGVRNMPEPTFTFCAPYGNTSTLLYSIKTTGGILDNSDSDTAVAAGDVLILGILPAGFRLDSMTAVVSSVLVGAAAVGFRYIDGVDSVKVPEQDDYFDAALSLAGAARVDGSGAGALVTLPKDAYLIATCAGAQTADGLAEILIQGVLTGKDE